MPLGLAGICLLFGCGAPSTVPSVPGVRISIDTTFYDATGTSPREWLASARRNAVTVGVRPPYLAHTAWSTRWTYPSSRAASSGCGAQNPQVALSIRFSMPRLLADSAVSTEDRMEWLRFMHSLWTHEEGHALRGVHAAAELRDSLQRIHSESCTLLSPILSEAARRVVEKYTLLQARYDEQTQHGARQGAFIIPVRGARLAMDTPYRDTVP